MIFTKNLNAINAFVAGDKTLIKEFVHPKNDPIVLPYSLAHASVAVGQSSEPHILRRSSELYIVLEGEGTLYVNGEAVQLRDGSAALVPEGATQWIQNTGVEILQFYVIVTPPWSAEEEDILKQSF